MLGSHNAKVSEAESGVDALSAIRLDISNGYPYQIVLLDMRMPEMDGLEVTKRIRREAFPGPTLHPDVVVGRPEPAAFAHARSRTVCLLGQANHAQRVIRGDLQGYRTSAGATGAAESAHHRTES
jgi:CheY-like chemotaxis protein